MSCLAADIVAFNSQVRQAGRGPPRPGLPGVANTCPHAACGRQFNRDSFLASLDSFVNKMPDLRPKGLAAELLPKCVVLHFPLPLRALFPLKTFPNPSTAPLHIVWAHRCGTCAYARGHPSTAGCGEGKK